MTTTIMPVRNADGKCAACWMCCCADNVAAAAVSPAADDLTVAAL